MTTPAIAANAYSTVANVLRPDKTAASPAASGGSDESKFGNLVKTAVEGVVESGKNAETKSLAMMSGKADVVDVVTAVAETEVALETMVSIRDRVISAYEEIMRMPI